jgi:hypothetical protein
MIISEERSEIISELQKLQFHMRLVDKCVGFIRAPSPGSHKSEYE